MTATVISSPLNCCQSILALANAAAGRPCAAVGRPPMRIAGAASAAPASAEWASRCRRVISKREPLLDMILPPVVRGPHLRRIGGLSPHNRDGAGGGIDPQDVAAANGRDRIGRKPMH